jgi:hypothetical protein
LNFFLEKKRALYIERERERERERSNFPCLFATIM